MPVEQPRTSAQAEPVAGVIFLYSTSPTPHETAILRAVRRPADDTGPIQAVALRAGVADPDDVDLARLRSHFCDRSGWPVELIDSGLGSRDDAHDPAVISGIERADLVLIGGGSPARILESTVGTPALAGLRAAWRRGAVIAGCSAGAIVLGAGLVEGGAPVRGWDWLSGMLVAPHFGRYDLDRWRQAFPGAPVLGVPDDAMAVITGGGDIVSLGEPEIRVLPVPEDQRRRH